MHTFATILLATEAAGEEAGGLDLILPALPELIWGLVGFALLAAFLWGRVFPAVNKVLDERAARIQGQIEDADEQRRQAEQLRRQYEEQLASAREQAAQIVDEARRDAERVRGEVTARADEEAQQIVARAREDAEASRARVVQDLRNQVALASVELAGRIVQRELDPERHRALVDQYINELSGLN
jgi:F-type H+-transporting ATPase subunit b